LVGRKSRSQTEIKEEVIGPGLAFQGEFNEEAKIVATIICGDSYFNENVEEAKKNYFGNGKENMAPDVFIARAWHLMREGMVLHAVLLQKQYRRSWVFRR